jgi:hypothetical protein
MVNHVGTGVDDDEVVGAVVGRIAVQVGAVHARREQPDPGVTHDSVDLDSRARARELNLYSQVRLTA